MTMSQPKPPRRSRRSQRQVIEAALATAGGFSDMDYDQAIEELDRIRHESKPTPPIDLDL